MDLREAVKIFKRPFDKSNHEAAKELYDATDCILTFCESVLVGKGVPEPIGQWCGKYNCGHDSCSLYFTTKRITDECQAWAAKMMDRERIAKVIDKTIVFRGDKCNSLEIADAIIKEWEGK